MTNAEIRLIKLKEKKDIFLNKNGDKSTKK